MVDQRSSRCSVVVGVCVCVHIEMTDMEVHGTDLLQERTCSHCGEVSNKTVSSQLFQHVPLLQRHAWPDSHCSRVAVSGD